MILSKNVHEWVYVGSPLTPNDLNGGEARFPEYHNVYIEPGSDEIYKRTNDFPEGPGENPDGSRTELSGRALFALMKLSGICASAMCYLRNANQHTSALGRCRSLLYAMFVVSPDLSHSRMRRQWW